MDITTKTYKKGKYEKFDKRDFAQECYGYLKTKLFMAKRISEQQLEIENLKAALFKMTLNYTNLFDLLKSKIKIN
jgi:hypothetical protein